MSGIERLKQAIGKEDPMLIDVLRFLYQIDFNHQLSCGRRHLLLTVTSNVDGWQNSPFIFEWNNSHYLKNQSEELINWLVSLI